MSDDYDNHVEGDRYHKELGFPENINLPTGNLNLNTTRHARREAQIDKYGYFELPSQQKLTQEMYNRKPRQAIGKPTKTHVFEITVEKNEVKFISLRKNLDNNRDMVLVIEPATGDIITAWSNLKSDEHENLQEEIYVTPE